MAVNFAKLQDFESARAVTMLLTAGRRVPKPSIPAVPALAQQSHTADEQKATEEHATPDIKTEKPAIGQSYKSHGCPLLGNAARPPRALGLEPLQRSRSAPTRVYSSKLQDTASSPRDISPLLTWRGIIDQQHCGLHGLGAEPIQGFLAGLISER